MCPVYKSGSKKQVNNYIPIALVSNFAKFFEKITFTRIYTFAMKHELINSRKFGFLEKKGTEDAIALLSKFIYENLKNSNPTVVKFLDYSKALDTIDQSILISKLHNLGIRGVCLSLIQSYLQNRKQTKSME